MTEGKEMNSEGSQWFMQISLYKNTGDRHRNEV